MPARPGTTQSLGSTAPAESGKDIERIAAFSDAIYAFSMTVLAVDIKVPIVTGNLATALPPAIVEQAPHVLSFVFAFLVVALFWTGHHRMFRHIRRVDSGLIWMNIFMLMIIAFMSVPAGYLGEYGEVALVAVLYAGVVVATSLCSVGLWWHAATAGLLDMDLNPRVVRLLQLRTLATAIVFAVSIPIAITMGASAAEWSWLAILPIRAFINRQYRDVQSQIYGDA
jgi:uncharacterized membrane protein